MLSLSSYMRCALGSVSGALLFDSLLNFSCRLPGFAIFLLTRYRTVQARFSLLPLLEQLTEDGHPRPFNFFGKYAIVLIGRKQLTGGCCVGFNSSSKEKRCNAGLAGSSTTSEVIKKALRQDD